MNQILPERARWSYLARSGLPAVSRKKNFSESHIINPLLTKLVWSRWLDIGLVLFLRVYGPRRNAQKKNLVNIQPSWPHIWSITRIYYTASSASGQDEPNRALWLATRAGKMEPSCPLGTTRCIPQVKCTKSHIINPILTSHLVNNPYVLGTYTPASFGSWSFYLQGLLCLQGHTLQPSHFIFF